MTVQGSKAPKDINSYKNQTNDQVTELSVPASHNWLGVDIGML